LAFFITSKPIININSVFTTVKVEIVIDELAFVFMLKVRDLEGSNTSCRVDDIITADARPPDL